MQHEHKNFKAILRSLSRTSFAVRCFKVASKQKVPKSASYRDAVGSNSTKFRALSESNLRQENLQKDEHSNHTTQPDATSPWYEGGRLGSGRDWLCGGEQKRVIYVDRIDRVRMNSETRMWHFDYQAEVTLCRSRFDSGTP